MNRPQAVLRGLATATALGLASAAYQAAGEARDRRRFPPPGRLVDVGGYRLHLLCAGQGSPAVVVIPALGGAALGWLTIQRSLATETTVCLYDRAGLGWSDPPHGRRTAQAMAGELHALLERAPISPPYVLVGHSAGGLLARMYAHLYPGQVAGLALIDSSHPEQPRRLPKVGLPDYPAGRWLYAAAETARPVGLLRLADDLGAFQGLRAKARGACPPDMTGAWIAITLSSRQRRAQIQELLDFDLICRDTAAVTGGLGNLPLTVITSSERDPHYPAGSRPQHARSRYYPAWAELQDELAALSTNSTHIVAKNAGHHIHRDDPALVTGAITALGGLHLTGVSCSGGQPPRRRALPPVSGRVPGMVPHRCRLS